MDYKNGFYSFLAFTILLIAVNYINSKQCLVDKRHNAKVIEVMKLQLDSCKLN